MLKKLAICASVATIVLASCSDKNEEPNTRTLAGNVPVVVIPMSPSADAVITEMPIRITQYFDRNSAWIVKVNKFDVPGGNQLTFETPELASTEMNGNMFVNSLSNFDAEDGRMIRDFRLSLYNNYYYLSMNPNSSTVAAPYGTIVACNFKVGADYSVASFPSQAYYGGATVTTYAQGGEQKEFTNQVPLYYIGIDLAKRTAQVTIYNAKFAETMPMALSAVTLRGLKIEPSRQYGYVISGDNLVPGVGIGANEVEYPQYTFDHFEMHPTNVALTSCEINYTVAGHYVGAFTGSYPVE